MRSFLARQRRNATNANRLRDRKYQNSLTKIKLAESPLSLAHWVAAFQGSLVAEVVTSFEGFQILHSGLPRNLVETRALTQPMNSANGVIVS